MIVIKTHLTGRNTLNLIISLLNFALCIKVQKCTVEITFASYWFRFYYQFKCSIRFRSSNKLLYIYI